MKGKKIIGAFLTKALESVTPYDDDTEAEFRALVTLTRRQAMAQDSTAGAYGFDAWKVIEAAPASARRVWGMHEQYEWQVMVVAAHRQRQQGGESK